MQALQEEPIFRRSYRAADLVRDHPAKLRYPKKKRVYELACPANCIHMGTLHVSRWNALPLTQVFARHSNVLLECREDVFGYEPAPEGCVEWHLNFSDPNLFFAYGGPMFAQDEIQVAEHPALASVLEALLAENLLPLTVERSCPTPILISGVERRCIVATDCNAGQGRPEGLYGFQFARAKIEAVEAATRPIVPPTQSNIIAMAAPACGRGLYAAHEIEYVLKTAFTGFAAAKSETERLFGSKDNSVKTVVHTGFWGCGAFGGNRILMIILQIIVARLAAIDRLVFHSVTTEGASVYSQAGTVLSGLLLEGNWLTRLIKPRPTVGDSIPLNELMKAVHAMGFEWGISDGN